MLDELPVKNRVEKPSLNPWVIILISAPAPVLLFLFFFYQWYGQKGEYQKLSNYFIERQNTILAYDAMEISTGFSDLLYKVSRDLRIFALLTPTRENLQEFYKAQIGDYSRYDPKNSASAQEPLPFYNRLAVLDENLNSRIQLEGGKVEIPGRTFAQCETKNLCDRALFDKAKAMKVGELLYGKILRYYTPNGQPDEDPSASLSVLYRGAKAFYLLGIDYRHLRDHLTTPSFPYETKRNLQDAYERGNYIYIVDSDLNIIAHPRSFHVVGIDPKTGQPVPPMEDDAHTGKRPINIAAYQRGRLKGMFERFLKVSFTMNGVDIFRSTNLAGTSRILSVAPIYLTEGQFAKTGIYGHVIIGCNVDYFQEPKERIVPYF